MRLLKWEGPSKKMLAVWTGFLSHLNQLLLSSLGMEAAQIVGVQHVP
jgi:hypothetical protein